MNAAARKQALKTEMTRVITEVMDDHPGPDFDTVASDAAEAVIKRFGLSMSSSMVDDNDPTKPITRFAFIDGQVDVDTEVTTDAALAPEPEPEPIAAPVAVEHVFNPYGALARGLR